VAALRRRVDAGLTLLIASHAPALLAAADTVLHLEDGCGVRDARDARAPLAIGPALV
jgi:ABC-type protease/lipase transport system fused ATPase/permease subunit